MFMIRQDVIDRVLDRADIVDIIGEAVSLKKAGANFVACCPFHQEKTPSFHVSPSRQTWHCFGQCQEGGNVIGFLMKNEGLTFPEAVKKLAARYSIDVEEDTDSPEKQQARMKREALAGLNERVATFYASLIRRKDKDSAAAWNYAVNRFGTEYVRETGIGFAPDAWDSLYKWAQTSGENIELLIELGLLVRKEETGKIYDAYRNRLMVPIRDRRRAVEGFTARRLDEDSEAPKYKNSKESELYHKSFSVFGIDIAWREACKSGLFYLVEGAPDAMKMQSVGLLNAVAPLGGAWTKGQMGILKKAAPSVCFINDADAVPVGKEWGAGIDYVLTNGVLALECGLMVSVREMPCKEGNLKQDPGDFFTSKKKLKELPEEDFIVWMARKLIRKDDTISNRSENVRRVAEAASYVCDDMRLEMLLTELCKIHRGKDLWQNTISKAKWERNKQEKIRRGEVDLRQYGFTAEDGCYYGMSDKGDAQWSNFTMKPLFHIRDSESPKRLFSVKNNRGREEIVEMTMEELCSIAKFRQRLEGIGNFTWMAGDRELIKLKSYLYEQTETASIIRQMGWNSAGFYAFGNGIWKDGSFHKADEFGVCRMGSSDNWYIHAASKLYREDRKKFERERKFIHQTLQNIKMGDYLARFVRVYGDNGKVGLCYFIASLFRDIVTSHTRSFPILDLFGPKGSGKTELGAALMGFFIPENKAPNLKNSTATALNDDVAFASNAMVHLDEYKNDVRPDKVEFLKGLYDGVGRVKMSGSGYDNRIMTSVKSGVVMSGQEMPTADIALFHRCIYLSFPRSEFSVEERRRFAELREIQKLGLTPLTLEVLALRGKVEGLFREKYNQVLDDINRQTAYRKFETRIVENWAKALAAFACVENALPWPMTYDEMLRITCDGITVQNDLSGTGNELAQFWRTILFLLNSGELFYDSDFKVKAVYKLENGTSTRVFEKPKRVLFLNPARIFQCYKKACIQMQENALPEDSMTAYLENADYFLGRGIRERFKKIVKGYAETYETTDGKRKEISKQVRAICFDYDIICERYGIELEEGLSETEAPPIIKEPTKEDQQLPF